jgi:hypothetical protein
MVLSKHPDIPLPRMAAIAAVFKLDEARHFVDLAKDIQDPREFRYNFDAAVEALVSALAITEEGLSQDKVQKRWFKKRVEELLSDATLKAVYDSRISAHHRVERAPLVEVHEVEKLPTFLTDLRADPGNPYSSVLIVRTSAPQDYRRRYWAIESNNSYLPAVECCKQLIAALESLLGEVRERVGLASSWPPGLGRVVTKIVEVP